MYSTAERRDEEPVQSEPAHEAVRIVSRRLGEFEIGSEQIFTLDRGLVGLGAARRFVLLEHRPGSLFRWMLCVDDPELAFVVADPTDLVAGYEAPLARAEAVLGCATTDVAVMVLVAIAGGAKEVSVNLLAPVVVDCRRRTGCQLVLEGSGLDPAHRIAPRA